MPFPIWHLCLCIPRTQTIQYRESPSHVLRFQTASTRCGGATTSDLSPATRGAHATSCRGRRNDATTSGGRTWWRFSAGRLLRCATGVRPRSAGQPVGCRWTVRRPDCQPPRSPWRGRVNLTWDRSETLSHCKACFSHYS